MRSTSWFTFLSSSLQLTLYLKQVKYHLRGFLQCCLVVRNNNIDSLTNAGGDSGSPRLAVLAGCCLLAFQTETRGAEKLTARVEVGAI